MHRRKSWLSGFSSLLFCVKRAFQLSLVAVNVEECFAPSVLRQREDAQKHAPCQGNFIWTRALIKGCQCSFILNEFFTHELLESSSHTQFTIQRLTMTIYNWRTLFTTNLVNTYIDPVILSFCQLPTWPISVVYFFFYILPLSSLSRLIDSTDITGRPTKSQQMRLQR